MPADAVDGEIRYPMRPGTSLEKPLFLVAVVIALTLGGRSAEEASDEINIDALKSSDSAITTSLEILREEEAPEVGEAEG